MTFRVGQKVVCIDDSSTDPAIRASLQRDGMVWPIKGTIYTVRWIGCWHFRDQYHPAVRLIEIVNPIIAWSDGTADELAFISSRFRPLIERRSQTDISFALDILDKVNGKMKESQRA